MKPEEFKQNLTVKRYLEAPMDPQRTRELVDLLGDPRELSLPQLEEILQGLPNKGWVDNCLVSAVRHEVSRRKGEQVIV